MGKFAASPTEVRLRPVDDRDAQDLFGLLALCFAHYPGCFVDPRSDLADLRTPATSISDRGGEFWVLEDPGGRICACVAVEFPERHLAELHRLYVRPDFRRRGVGARLVSVAETSARARDAGHLVLWSDTRFVDAHRLYERLGYTRTGAFRDLGDISGSVEFHFEKRLPDVQDHVAAGSALTA